MGFSPLQPNGDPVWVKSTYLVLRQVFMRCSYEEGMNGREMGLTSPGSMCRAWGCHLWGLQHRGFRMLGLGCRGPRVPRVALLGSRAAPAFVFLPLSVWWSLSACAAPVRLHLNGFCCYVQRYSLLLGCFLFHIQHTIPHPQTKQIIRAQFILNSSLLAPAGELLA
jgi:hypothetical protein